MIRRAILGLLLCLVVLAAPPVLIASAGAADPAPQPACVLQMQATAINDRAVGAIRCHGAIVPLRAVMLVG